MANAVIIVDMIRGFLEEGYPLSCGDQARRIIKPVTHLLEQELAEGGNLIFSRDAHAPEDPELASGLFPPHCLKDSIESQIIPELSRFIDIGDIFDKRAYSSFTNPAFNERLLSLRPDKLIIVGVCTDICVLHTTADAFFRHYNIEVPGNCVASFSDENHRFGLAHLRSALGAKESATVGNLINQSSR